MVVLAAVGYFVLPAQPAFADSGCTSGGTCIVINSWLSGTEKTVDLTQAGIWDNGQYPTDVGPGATYDIRNSDGSKGLPVTVDNGVSIGQLLNDDAGLAVPGDAFVSIPRTFEEQTWSTLVGPQLDKPDSQFADGLMPVVWTTADDVNYLRPLTSSKSDSNASDYITTQGADDPLVINVFTGQLTVKVTKSTTRTKHGTSVQLSATTTSGGSSPSGTLTYDWTINGNPAGGGASAKPQFCPRTSNCVFAGAVMATDSNGSGGQSLPFSVSVGKVSVGKQPTGGNGGKKPSPPPSTPPVAPPQPPGHRGPGTGNGNGNGKGKGQGNGKGGNGLHLPALGNLGLGDTLSSRLGNLFAGQQPLLATDAQLPLVSGQVIGAGTPISLSAASSDSSSPVTAAETEALANQTTRWSPGTIPVYVAVVLLLLGIGIGRERGWLTLRRR